MCAPCGQAGRHCRQDTQVSRYQASCGRAESPAVRRIHEEYATENLTVADLARLCSVTPEYFRRIFRSVYGVSPKRYINELKLSRAKELLQSGLYSVTEAALLSGYTDMSHFSRVFKKETGVSPKEF